MNRAHDREAAGAVSHRLSTSSPLTYFYRYKYLLSTFYDLRWCMSRGPPKPGNIPRREDFTMATHCTPNSRSAAVTGAGGLGREVAVQRAGMGYRVLGIARNDKDIGQHRGSSAHRGTGADRRHRHLSDRRAHSQSRLVDPASGDPWATRGQASWSLWASPWTTWLPRNSICAITIRDSRPTRARSAP
jgi:hypothetical protein